MLSTHPLPAGCKSAPCLWWGQTAAQKVVQRKPEAAGSTHLSLCLFSVLQMKAWLLLEGRASQGGAKLLMFSEHKRISKTSRRALHALARASHLAPRDASSQFFSCIDTFWGMCLTAIPTWTEMILQGLEAFVLPLSTKWSTCFLKSNKTRYYPPWYLVVCSARLDVPSTTQLLGTALHGDA